MIGTKKNFATRRAVILIKNGVSHGLGHAHDWITLQDRFPKKEDYFHQRYQFSVIKNAKC